MSIAQDMKTISGQVERWLAKDEKCKDNDSRLIAKVWSTAINYQWDMPVLEFFKLMSEGKLPASESIRRSRQALQEANPDLRGKSYRGRKDAQKPVKEAVQEVAEYGNPQGKLL